jgi:hypothetical protein
LKSLISENINTGLNNIIKQCFLGNRICDRAMSVLATKFAMTNSVNLLHPRLAHIFPKLADILSDYQADRDCLSVYGETPLDASDYVSPLDFFNKILDYMTELESLCYEVFSKAKDESDMTTFVFLQDFVKTLIPVTAQCLLLVDKAEAYGNQWMLFDHDAENFITLPVMAGKG